jgi:hypothetical protein
VPTYEITKGGETYEVTASTQEAALEALGVETEENTLMEDLQGAGQSVLDGVFLGFGDEISAAGRAGLSAVFDGLSSSTDAAPDFGSIDRLKQDYLRELESGRDIEDRFREEHGGVALGLEAAGGIATGGLLARGAGLAATRGANALRGAGIGSLEMGVYTIGEKEGDIEERFEALDPMDAAVIGAGAVLGGLGGSLVRGYSPDSATAGELLSAANKTVASGAVETAELVKSAGRYVEAAADSITGGRVSPVVESVVEGAIKPTVKAVAAQTAPARGAIGKQAEKMFVPVRDTANKIQVGYGNRMERGAINGQRGVEEVDRIMFQTHNLGRIRDNIVGNERAYAAMADMGNNELKWEKRQIGFKVLKEELGETDYNDLMKFLTDQEDMLNKYAPHTQTHKRKFGHISIARKTKDDSRELADTALEQQKGLRQEREAAEAAARLNTSDGTMRDKLSLARLSEDGSGTSRYHDQNPIHNPIESHHYFMRSNAQMGSMNKALGIRGAANAEEMELAAQGKFYQEQLRKAFADPTKADDAIELYNQVTWGSQRSMAKQLQVLRNLGYSSTIANPYGAMLQVHDGLNAAYQHGSANMIKSMSKKAGFDISMEEAGIVRQHFNEMMAPAAQSADFWGNAARQTESLLEWAMEKSLFKYGDTVMKGKIMQSGLLQEQALLKNNPSKWRQKWQYTFDKAELDDLAVALKNEDKSNDLLKQLGLLKLSKLQPISAASNTYYQLAVPNARLWYMLKGFAITQLSMIKNNLKRIQKEEGTPAMAKDLARYMILSAGGYGVVHETRQLAKGDLPDYSNVPALGFYQMLSILTMGSSGGTQYGFNKFTQAPLPTAIANFTVPPVGIAEGIAKDVSEAAFGSFDNPNKFVPDETIKDIPVIGPTVGNMVFED